MSAFFNPRARFRRKNRKLYHEQGRNEERVELFRRMTATDPKDPRFFGLLGEALREQGLAADAKNAFSKEVAVYNESVRLYPDDLALRRRFIGILIRQGLHDVAKTEFLKLLELDQSSTLDNIRVTTSLDAIRSIGCQIAPSIGLLEAEVKAKPSFAQGYENLANAYYEGNEQEKAVVAFRELIRLRPTSRGVGYNLGSALQSLRRFDEAIAAYRYAICLEPEDPFCHFKLGSVLQAQGKLDSAAGSYREAIRLKPDLAEAHYRLGLTLQAQGKVSESLLALRRAADLYREMPDLIRRPAVLSHLEMQISLATRLPGVLNGNIKPKDATEQLAFAQLCYDQGLHAAAARLWAEAFSAHPKLAEDLEAGTRYNAACSAVLAANGKGTGDPSPDEAARKKLRAQARDWLRADLSLRAKQLASGSKEDQKEVREEFAHWKSDADLWSIRDPEALAKLPEVERKEWQALWSEVDALPKSK
jgi:tetratricopeptide (TPR) repeat protein